MKKFLFIFFFFLLLIPLKKEKLETVFYEESTSYYELDVSKCNVTTNNILDKVDGSIIKNDMKGLCLSKRNTSFISSLQR